MRDVTLLPPGRPRPGVPEDLSKKAVSASEKKGGTKTVYRRRLSQQFADRRERGDGVDGLERGNLNGKGALRRKESRRANGAVEAVFFRNGRSAGSTIKYTNSRGHLLLAG